MTITDRVEALRAFLSLIRPGSIDRQKIVYERVADAWPYLDCDAGRMRAEKIHGRLEKITWNPPVLSFQVDGDHWEVDVENRTRNIVRSSGSS